MRHSQSFNDTPVKAWVAVSHDGVVRTAHCNCMAGLNECCSHSSAILFAIMSALNVKNGTACTSMKQKWHEPSRKLLTKVEYMEGHNILFSSSQRRKKPKVNSDIPPSKTSSSVVMAIPCLTENECSDFYNSLVESEKKETNPVKSAILSIIPQHANRFIPRTVQLDLPPPLTDLFSSTNRSLSEEELATKCQDVFSSMAISQEQVLSHFKHLHLILIVVIISHDCST